MVHKYILFNKCDHFDFSMMKSFFFQLNLFRLIEAHVPIVNPSIKKQQTRYDILMVPVNIEHCVTFITLIWTRV